MALQSAAKGTSPRIPKITKTGVQANVQMANNIIFIQFREALEHSKLKYRPLNHLVNLIAEDVKWIVDGWTFTQQTAKQLELLTETFYSTYYRTYISDDGT